jgi:hypothetical protein
MIFNKSNNGAEEFKALIGFIYASNKFENLVTYIGFAKKDVVNVVGHEIYRLAEDHYKSDDFGTDGDADEFVLLNELVNRVQLPIALHAYRRFAPGNDLSHSDAGRQITVTETEKPAFEWMLDKDNANLLSLSNDAVELLLDFLAEQLVVPEGETINAIGDAWQNSDAFAAINSTIVNSVTAFEQNMPINGSRRLFMLLSPFIRSAENDLIRPVITKTRYDALIEAIRDGELSDEQKEIVRLASPVIVMHSMAKALKRIPAEILPDVFGQRFIDDRKTDIDTDSRLGAAQVLQQEATLELLKLQRYIKQITPVTEEVIPESVDTTKPYFMF